MKSTTEPQPSTSGCGKWNSGSSNSEASSTKQFKWDKTMLQSLVSIFIAHVIFTFNSKKYISIKEKSQNSNMILQRTKALEGFSVKYI